MIYSHAEGTMADNPVSISGCRTMLGDLASGKTDVQVEAWRDNLTVVANQMFDHLKSKMRVEPESIIDAASEVLDIFASSEEKLKRDVLERIRWIAHAHENGVLPDDEDAK